MGEDVTKERVEASNGRYSRQSILPEIGASGQQALSESTVVVIGCGALGTHSADLLVRAGFGHVRIVDRDLVELSNLQRQMLFDEDDASSGLPKAVAAAKKLMRVNSEVRVEPLVCDVTPNNIEQVIDSASVVLDGTDNFETRYLVNDACVKHGVPWVYAGVIGTEGMTLTVVPGRGPCLRCLNPVPPEPGTLPTCEMAGVLNTAPALLASLQVTEACRLLIEPEKTGGEVLSIELWRRRFGQVRLERDSNCPTCGQKRYEFLDDERISWTTRLCGRNAVQITPHEGATLSLERLRAQLDSTGDVEINGYLLRVRVEGLSLLLFPDGRAIIQGTTDESVARSLYAKYVGM